MSWLLAAVAEAERVRLEPVLAACPTLTLRAGTSLERDARLERATLLAVEEGLVVVSARPFGTRRRVIVALAGPGSLLLPPVDRERLEVLAGARVTVLSETAQRELLEVPEAAAAIARGLAARLRDCQESLSQFADPHHAGRVRQKLDQLARAHGKVGTGGMWLSLPLTHEVLAAMVGSTRETVTRAMSVLAREGVVRHERGAYRVVFPPGRSGL